MQIIGLPCPGEDTVENTDLQGRCQPGKKQRKGAGFARYGSLPLKVKRCHFIERLWGEFGH